MARGLAVLVVSALVLSGCATVRDSRVNPFNWFGGGSGGGRVVQSADAAANPLIPQRRNSVLRNDAPEVYPGRPVGQIAELSFEPRPGGAILRVTGVADTPNVFDVRLTRAEAAEEPGTVTFTLEAVQAQGPAGATVAARSVTAAAWLADQELAGVSEIRVQGARNVQVARR
ncbi:hypothetical protein [Allosediminivita pacifica]|uniref:Lipoprotein n=1 Tax=Allosediminivita pacifica TaxID=1267769 RepID=A0A2T6B7N8_9RHOB|nr:hypothetical protein [Allosediminivita pacifica]PTX52100.1 hypothetical protein C8N44_102145 [Allosediminivita pacifica]GGA97143.1 hypothetical protein GCM10011324_04270 [Allosediminivita pacifica]